MITPILFGLACAIIAVVYASVLPLEDTPLNGWFHWLSRMKDHDGWRSWVASPLGACAKCTAGQLALWSSSVITPWSLSLTAIGVHVLSACSAVLCAAMINAMYRWIKRQP